MNITKSAVLCLCLILWLAKLSNKVVNSSYSPSKEDVSISNSAAIFLERLHIVLAETEKIISYKCMLRGAVCEMKSLFVKKYIDLAVSEYDLTYLKKSPFELFKGSSPARRVGALVIMDMMVALITNHVSSNCGKV